MVKLQRLFRPSRERDDSEELRGNQHVRSQVYRWSYQGQAPIPAQITTTNYPATNGDAPLSIKQWIITGDGKEVDTTQHSAGGVYDWVQARARDIFAANPPGPGDLATVLAAVKNYTVSANVNGDGETNNTRAAQSPIVINVFRTSYMRIDAVAGGTCQQNGQQNGGRLFTGTLIHEARHAYQAAQTIALPGNDMDQDWLVKTEGTVEPAGTTLDTMVSRNVCNPYAPNGAVFMKGYLGDMAADPFMPDINNPNTPNDRSGYAYYALEMDAVVFAANHTPHQ